MVADSDVIKYGRYENGPALNNYIGCAIYGNIHYTNLHLDYIVTNNFNLQKIIQRIHFE